MKKYLSGVFLFLIVMSGVLPLILGFNIVESDAQMHLVKIYQFYQSFRENNFWPRIAATLFYGYGLPTFVAGSNLSYYLVSFFLALKFSYGQAYVAVSALCYIVSSLGIYLAVRALFKNRLASLFATAIWTFASYRLVLLYARSAFWEVTAGIFPGWSIYTAVLSRRRPFVGFVLQSFLFAWLIASHLPSVIVFAPITFLFVLFTATKKVRDLILLTLSTAFGAAISAFAILPVIFERNYLMATRTLNHRYEETFTTLTHLFRPLSHFTEDANVSVDWIIAVIMILLIIFLWKRRRNFPLVLFLLTIFFISLFLNLRVSTPIWKYVPFFRFALFPFRYFAVTALAGSLGGAYLLTTLKIKPVLGGILIFGISTIMLYLFWSSVPIHNDWTSLAQTDFSAYHGTASAENETVPMGISEDVNHGNVPSGPRVISGDAQVTEISGTNIRRHFIVEAKTPAIISTGVLYYPGWLTIVDDQERFSSNGFVTVDNLDYSGIITQAVGYGHHVVDLRFQETPLRLLANLITTVSILFWLFLFLLAINQNPGAALREKLVTFGANFIRS